MSALFHQSSLHTLASLRKNFFSEVFFFLVSKLRQHPIRNRISSIPSDAYFAPREFFRPEMCRYGFETVLSSGTSLVSQANLPKVHINVVGKHQNILQGYLIKIHKCTNRLAGAIHIRRGLQENGFLAVPDPFGDDPLKSGVSPVLEIPFFPQEIREKKPDVVPGVCVFFSRVSESDDEFHVSYLQVKVFTRSSYFVVLGVESPSPKVMRYTVSLHTLAVWTNFCFGVLVLYFASKI